MMAISSFIYLFIFVLFEYEDIFVNFNIFIEKIVDVDLVCNQYVMGFAHHV